MPIKGLTGQVRTPRWARIRLGYTKQGKKSKYPGDTDVFVLKREGDSDVVKGILAAYHGELIEDAAENARDERGQAKQVVYRIGRTLRLMLPWEFDTMHGGREVSLELTNRSWAASKLRCSGDGGGSEPELVGQAVCRDQAYLGVFQRAGLVIGETRGGGHTVTCRGPECPMWHTARGDLNKLPGCHREMRLQALLLHPATNPEDPDYMRQLGWIEVATGSWHGAVDVQSGLAMLRSTVGRTHHVPFTLRRLMRSISTPEGRVQKATLVVSYDMDEALRFALGPPARALLRPEVRRELLELAAAEVQFESMADIQPQPDRLALPAPAPPSRTLAPPPPVIDRDDAAEAARREAEGEDEPGDEGPAEVVRKLTQEDVDALKVACGGTPGEPTTLTRYRELVEASYHAIGTKASGEWESYEPIPGAPIGQASYLTTRHRAWIEDQLRTAEPAVIEGEWVDPDDEDRS